MNFSHGSYEYHQSVIDNTRKMIAGTARIRFTVGDVRAETGYLFLYS